MFGHCVCVTKRCSTMQFYGTFVQIVSIQETRLSTPKWTFSVHRTSIRAHFPRFVHFGHPLRGDRGFSCPFPPLSLQKRSMSVSVGLKESNRTRDVKPVFEKSTPLTEGAQGGRFVENELEWTPGGQKNVHFGVEIVFLGWTHCGQMYHRIASCCIFSSFLCMPQTPRGTPRGLQIDSGIAGIERSGKRRRTDPTRVRDCGMGVSSLSGANEVSASPPVSFGRNIRKSRKIYTKHSTSRNPHAVAWRPQPKKCLGSIHTFSSCSKRSFCATGLVTAGSSSIDFPAFKALLDTRKSRESL